MTVEAADFASGPIVCTISVHTTYNKTYGPFGQADININTHAANKGNPKPITTYVSVDGKILRYISGASGTAVDRLVFYFA